MDARRFDELLTGSRGALERLAHVKIHVYADAEDVIQENSIVAYGARASLWDGRRFAHG